jgi:hypothetical protein
VTQSTSNDFANPFWKPYPVEQLVRLKFTSYQSFLNEESRHFSDKKGITFGLGMDSGDEIRRRHNAFMGLDNFPDAIRV